MTVVKIVVAVIFGALFLGSVLLRIMSKLNPWPAPAFLGPLLDNRCRRWLQPPVAIVRRSGVQPGMTATELGCGSGAYITAIARAVGVEGKVYAVDIQEAMLRQVKRKLSRNENQDISNIELVQASAYGLPFPDDSLDLVIMITALPEIPDRGKALKEIKRVLKPGGILALSEYLPDPDYPLRSTTVKICQREGFRLEEAPGNLWSYTARFKKPV